MHLLSKPEEWEPQQRECSESTGLKYHAYYSSMKRLEEFGYIQKHKKRDGRRWVTECDVYADPLLNPAYWDVDSLSSDNTVQD